MNKTDCKHLDRYDSLVQIARLVYDLYLEGANLSNFDLEINGVRIRYFG